MRAQRNIVIYMGFEFEIRIKPNILCDVRSAYLAKDILYIGVLQRGASSCCTLIDVRTSTSEGQIAFNCIRFFLGVRHA